MNKCLILIAALLLFLGASGQTSRTMDFNIDFERINDSLPQRWTSF